MASQISKSGRGSRGGLSGATGGSSSLLQALRMEGGGHKPRSARWLLETGKEEEMDSPIEPPERNTALLTHLSSPRETHVGC